MRRDDEVGRRGHAPVDAAGEVEFRLVAGAEETAEPVGTQVRGRDVLAERRRAAEVRADADGDPHARLDRAVLVARVGRLLVLARGRVGETLGELRKRREHVGRALHDPAHLAAPLDVDLLARLELADVDLDRGAGRFRALAREERHHERHGCRDRADPAHDAGRADQEASLPLVHRCFGCHDRLAWRMLGGASAAPARECAGGRATGRAKHHGRPRGSPKTCRLYGIRSVRRKLPVLAGLEKPGGSSGCVQESGRPAEGPAPPGAIIRVPRPATSASDPC